jgi:hypothetical protein
MRSFVIQRSRQTYQCRHRRNSKVINLKTAKVLSLDVPLSLQQRADEAIE